MDTIITIQGDTWDTIARRAYGDEKAAQALMEARENIRLLDYQIFPGGVPCGRAGLAGGNAAGQRPPGMEAMSYGTAQGNCGPDLQRGQRHGIHRPRPFLLQLH